MKDVAFLSEQGRCTLRGAPVLKVCVTSDTSGHYRQTAIFLCVIICKSFRGYKFGLRAS
jgi:hypothetical protein